RSDGVHRDLRSLPTRRSSDLAALAADAVLSALARGDVVATGYAEARRSTFRDKAALCLLIQGFLGARPLLDYAVARIASRPEIEDRKSTRLNSSHVKISYAVF